MANTKKTIEIEVTGIAGLKQELRATKDALVDIANLEKDSLEYQALLAKQGVKNYEELAQKAGKLKDDLSDINEQIGVMAGGSRWEKMGNSIGDMGSKLKNLDFEGLAASAKQFADISSQGTRKEKFAEAGKAVGDLGKTFMNVGKALITNPLVLLGTVIGLIVVQIVKMLEKMGVMDVIMKAVGKAVDFLMIPIKALIKGLMDLTDWLGLTTFAADENAKAMAKSNDAIIASNKARSEKTASMYDFEIDKLKAAGFETGKLERMKSLDVQKEASNRYNIYKKEYESIKNSTTEANVERRKTLVAAMKEESGIIKAEFQGRAISRIEDATKAASKAKEANEKAVQAQKDALAKMKAYQDNRRAAERTAIDLRIDLMEDGYAKEKAILDEANRRSIEDITLNANLTGTAIKDANNKIIGYTGEKGEQIKLLEEKYSKDSKNLLTKDNEQKEAKQKAYNDYLLGLESDITKQLINNENKRYNDEIKFLDAALKDKTISQEEYNRAIEKARSKHKSNLQKIDDDAANTAKLKELQKAADDAAIKLLNDNATYEQKKNAIEANRQLELAAADLTARQIAEINAKYNKEQEDLDKAELDKKIKVYDDFANIIKGVTAEGNKALGTLFETTAKAITDFTRLSETEFKNTADKVAAYTQAIGGIIQGFVTANAEFQAQKAQENLDNIANANEEEKAALAAKYESGIINKEEYDRAVTNLDDKSNQMTLAIKKKAFEDEKSSKIATATIAGITGAVQAFAGAMSLGVPAGPIVGGVLAASVAAMTAMNISKIKATKFNSGGSSSSPAPSSPAPSSANNVPSVNLFGSAQNSNNQGANQNTNQNVNVNVTPITVNAVVSETQISETTERLTRYRQMSEIG